MLCHTFPKADIPIVRLSIDRTQPVSFHYELGELLSPLWEEGVLIIESGNLVHNLHACAWGEHPIQAYDWSGRFEQQAREFIITGDYASLINCELLGSDAMQLIPTSDHYLPLLYVLALRQENVLIDFPVEGVDGGSVSMLTVRVGS